MDIALQRGGAFERQATNQTAALPHGCPKMFLEPLIVQYAFLAIEDRTPADEPEGTERTAGCRGCYLSLQTAHCPPVCRWTIPQECATIVSVLVCSVMAATAFFIVLKACLVEWVPLYI